MNTSKIGYIEAIALIIVVILNHLVLNLPESIINLCGSSSILNVIFVSILVFILLYFIIKLFKNFSNSDILDVSHFLGGKPLQVIIGILFICYFIIISSTQLRNFCEILKLVYFTKTPIAILVICFLAIAVISNKFGLKTIVRTNIIVVPLVMINLLIAFFCVSDRFVIERIFPIFGYGINKTFFSGATNIFAFTGISYILFLQPMLEKQEKFKTISFIGIGISSLYLILSIMSLLFSFADFLNINSLSPIYLLIRGTDFGRFLQRPDAIFFLGWILCLMSYLSITIFLVTHIFQKIGNQKHNFLFSFIVAIIMFIVALLQNNMAEIRFIQNYIYKYFTIILVFIISMLILIIANIKYKKTHRLVKERDLLNE